jgi:hypothetical protein
MSTIKKLKDALVARNQDYGDVAELVDKLEKENNESALLNELEWRRRWTQPPEMTTVREVTVKCPTTGTEIKFKMIGDRYITEFPGDGLEGSLVACFANIQSEQAQRMGEIFKRMESERDQLRAEVERLRMERDRFRADLGKETLKTDEAERIINRVGLEAEELRARISELERDLREDRHLAKLADENLVLMKQVAELERDKARLDWCELHAGRVQAMDDFKEPSLKKWYVSTSRKTPESMMNTIRRAIDDARLGA